MTQKTELTFAKAFINGVTNTLSVQCKLPVTLEAPIKFGPQSNVVGKDCVGASIAVAANGVEGHMLLYFPEATFIKVMGAMFNENFPAMKPELSDGAAELTNIIFGYAKTVLGKSGAGLKMARPVVVRADEVTKILESAPGALVFPFKSNVGVFHMALCNLSARQAA